MKAIFDGGMGFALALAVATVMTASMDIVKDIRDGSIWTKRISEDNELLNIAAQKVQVDNVEVENESDRSIRLLTKAIDESQRQLQRSAEKADPQTRLPNGGWSQDLVRDAIEGVDMIELYGATIKVG
jgi:hypothetical protein